MATLIVQGGDLYHDAYNFGILGDSTLVVADAYHLHDADAIVLNQLNVQNGWHDHVSNHLTVSINPVLTVQGASHLHRADETYVGYLYIGKTNPLDIPKLPALKATASFSTRAKTPTGGLRLPGISCDARAGSHLTERLPIAEIEATASLNSRLFVDAKLPSLEVSGMAGIRSGTMSLPTMEISAEFSDVHRGNLDRQLPGIEGSASGEVEGLGTLDADLPAIEALVSIDAEILATMDRSLPPPIISATMSLNQTMTLDGTLPTLESYMLGDGTSLSLSAYIPPPIMITAGDGVGAAVLVGTSRYDDSVLRYSR